MTRIGKIVAILPAYNAEKTLIPFIRNLPKDLFDEVILVDDCSFDKTFEIAKEEKGISAYRNFRNLGYGGNLKMCLGIALEHKADVVVELHPDGEYGFDAVVPALDEVGRGIKFVLGNRFSSKLARGMYLHKYIFNRLFSFLDNLILGSSIPDLHQGFRVYTKDLLGRVNYKANSNNYLFSFEIICQAIFNKISVSSVPVDSFYQGKKRGAYLLPSIIYSLGTFKILTWFVLAKLGLVGRLFKIQGKSFQCPNCINDYLVEERFSLDQFNVFYCKICGNGFTRPIPKNIEVFYPPTYWNYAGWFGYFRKVAFGFFQKRRQRWVQKYLPKGGIILDVGSGEGNFSKSLDENYKVVNLEAPFAWISNENVLKLDFLEWKTGQKFDAVCFWESLEHVPNPQLYLEKAYGLLKKGGLIFIEYPRYNSLESKIFGASWFHLDIPRHFSQFTDKGLMILLLRVGFTKVLQNPVLALEYGPAGFLLSLMSALKIKKERLINKSGNIIFLILLILFLLPSLIIEFLLFLARDSSIGLTVGRKE